MKKFNEEAIDKILDMYDGNIEPLRARVRALIDMSGELDNFSGKADSTVGEVKFIYETAGIRKKEK